MPGRVSAGGSVQPIRSTVPELYVRGGADHRRHLHYPIDSSVTRPLSADHPASDTAPPGKAGAGGPRYSRVSPSTRTVTTSVPWYCWWRTDEA